MERRIRILHVAQAAGGVDRYLQMLLKNIDHTRFENIVVLSQDFRREDYESLVDGYERVEMQRSIGRADLAAAHHVRSLIRQYHPDIVYAHSSKAGAIARLANIGLPSKCIYNPHGWAFNMVTTPRKRCIYTWIERIAAIYCDHIICISQAERQAALANRICSDDKMQVVLNGIDIDAYKQCEHDKVHRRDLSIPDNAFVVGMVGRISWQKAPDVYIRAARRIHEAIPLAHFLLVGNGVMEQMIREEATANGLQDCLHLTGWVEDPLDYMTLFDVACLTSRWEGFGLVLPEYMMVGRPIVATNVDAIPEIIQDGENGLLAQSGNDAMIAEDVIRLYQDPELRKRLVANARDSLRRFDIRRVAREHEEMFIKVLERQ